MENKINFWKWFLTFNNIAVVTAYIFFTTTIILQLSYFDPVMWGYVALGLIQLMGIIFVFKIRQHWQDLKKNISR